MDTQQISVVTFEESPYFTPFLQQHSETTYKRSSNILYTDEALIAGLNRQDTVIIKYIYKQFYQQIKSFVVSNTGAIMDAEDVFQDALVIIYKKITSGNFKLECSFSTFLYSVCKNLWLQRLTRQKFSNEFKASVNPHQWHDTNESEETVDEFEKYKLFQQHFLKLKEDDQKVLKLFISKVSLKEIARIMGYKSEKYAKTRKYICKEKLKNSIMNDPRYREIYGNEFMSPVI